MWHGYLMLDRDATEIVQLEEGVPRWWEAPVGHGASVILPSGAFLLRIIGLS